MNTVKFGDFCLSGLMLGTAQFGLNYGIANKQGRLSYEIVRDIIKYAYEQGVNCLDTAARYGRSEELIGKALVEIGLKNKIIVVSKVHYTPEDFPHIKSVDAFLEKMVARSLKLLHLKVLPLCLFHSEESFCYIDSLLRLKDKGLIAHIGSSVYSPRITSSIIASGKVEAIQFPFNILDKRFICSNVFKEAQTKNVALFARSVYLQGIILMPENEIPPALKEVISVRRKLEKLAYAAGISLAELAIRYVISHKEITSILVGVDSLEQMRQNINLFLKGPLDSDIIDEIRNSVPQLPQHIVMPTKWPEKH